MTEFEFQLHPVGPLVNLGMFFWDLDQGAEALRLGRDLFGTLPRNANAMIISVNAPPAPFVPEQFHFMPGYIVVVVGFGSAQDHAGMLAPIRAEAIAVITEQQRQCHDRVRGGSGACLLRAGQVRATGPG